MLLTKAGKTSIDAVVQQAYENAREDLYYYILTLGLSAGPAQDVAQEVFLKLYLQLRKGEEIRNVRAWLFRVAHNEGLKWKAKERVHSEIVPEWELADDRRSTEHQMIEDQFQKRFRRAMAELSPQQRQVLHLRAEGLRYREIAETIGIGTSTVNEFMRRAVARLRKAIHE